ncbi:uncharacterized protein LOC111443521 isoform X3 [Cucurbita moschata]|uniref:Uncharacterized protein LOC111443521 isoform X3 n=1 Tax=Cucurbita moschata TaxID=3662 RepID=A0A6J1FAA0_CUCMO|nr:uncharacterized protein LOC111443521 isoform X3 [Cucurbita moschata]
MSVIGWYGPLIDLSEAALHVGDFVQLVVFIHRSTPVEYKLSNGGEVIRTDIKVADDTRSFFSVSLWQKKMAATAIPGDVVLLQSKLRYVKLRKFGDSVEATTVQCSSLVCIIHPYETLFSEGVDELTANCRVGLVAKEKLRKVVEWVKGARSTFRNIKWHSDQNHFFRNWKLPEKRMSRDCFSLSEVLCLTESCKVIFDASIGEMFSLPPLIELDEPRKEKLFVSRRLYDEEDFDLAEDLICTGCQLCGTPLGLESGSVVDQLSAPLYCSKSLNRLHVVSMIYRPFMHFRSSRLSFMMSLELLVLMNLPCSVQIYTCGMNQNAFLCLLRIKQQKSCLVTSKLTRFTPITVAISPIPILIQKLLLNQATQVLRLLILLELLRKDRGPLKIYISSG